MNEIVKLPSKKIKTNSFNYNILFLFVLFFIFRSTLSNKKASLNINNLLNKLSLNKIKDSLSSNANNNFDFLNNIDIYDIRRKVNIFMKTAPYLPEQVVYTVNKIYPYYEKINAIISLVEFVKSSNSVSSVVANNNINQKDKISKIMAIMKDEMPNSTINNIAPLVELGLNFDKIKPVINMFTSNNSNKTNSNTNPLDSILSALGPMLSGDSKESTDKTKDLLPMMEILKVLMSSDEEKKEA